MTRGSVCSCRGTGCVHLLALRVVHGTWAGGRCGSAGRRRRGVIAGSALAGGLVELVDVEPRFRLPLRVVVRPGTPPGARAARGVAGVRVPCRSWQLCAGWAGECATSWRVSGARRGPAGWAVSSWASWCECRAPIEAWCRAVDVPGGARRRRAAAPAAARPPGPPARTRLTLLVVARDVVRRGVVGCGARRVRALAGCPVRRGDVAGAVRAPWGRRPAARRGDRGVGARRGVVVWSSSTSCAVLVRGCRCASTSAAAVRRRALASLEGLLEGHEGRGSVRDVVEGVGRSPWSSGVCVRGGGSGAVRAVGGAVGAVRRCAGT